MMNMLLVYAAVQSSSTTKTGRHDRAEILLKVALKHQKSITILFHMFLLIMIPDK
jgi:hypothetical protein